MLIDAVINRAMNDQNCVVYFLFSEIWLFQNHQTHYFYYLRLLEVAENSLQKCVSLLSIYVNIYDQLDLET
jgi:hypothetical protein